MPTHRQPSPTSRLSRITIDDESSEPEHLNPPETNHDLTPENNQQNPQRTHQRRRSQSVATAQPSVETVVVKAKRAASNLWTLLHAQSCVLADKCPHAGCQEAKRLHLHIKTCSAGSCDFSCPENYAGCEQARKLLAHYKRCRTQRARQAGLMSTSPRQQQLSCLVCSLVARQARSTLERSAFSKKTVVSVNSRSSKIGSTSPSSLLVMSKDLVVPSSAEKMPPPPPRSSASKVRFQATHDEILITSSYEDDAISLHHSLRTCTVSDTIHESKEDPLLSKDEF